MSTKMKEAAIKAHVFAEQALHSDDWQLHAEASPLDEHQVTFAVRQRNVDQLESILYAVSDPRSPQYGKHWSKEKISRFTENPEASQAVRDFAAVHNLSVVKESLYGEYITVKGNIRQLSTVFDTQFFEYHRIAGARSKHAGKKVFRAQSYSLPTELVDHVSTVFEVVHLPVPSRIKARVHRNVKAPVQGSLRTEAVTGYVSPALIKSQYDIVSNNGLVNASQGIYAALDQYLDPTDLTKFQNTFNLPVQSVSFQVGDHVADNQCGSTGDDCIEANLDVQYIMGVAWYVPTTFYYWDDSQDFMVGWLKEVMTMENIPHVFSISYGAEESGVSSSYASQFNTEAAKIGIMGVTLIASSGDDGAVPSSASGAPSRCAYAPVFPASSPYVTAVGATMGPEAGDPEVACQAGGEVSITTGGGFSIRYSRPSFQDSFVSDYFATVNANSALTPVAGYSTSGRGIPDVALMGHNYYVIVNNNAVYVDGTSASAPVFAGMVALLNSYRLANGSDTVGWLNPALYNSTTTYANDITSGNNKCTSVYGGSYGNYQTTCCSQGFYATTGWDPVTGLGSIDFNAFVQQFASVTPYEIPGGGTTSSGGSNGSKLTTTTVAIIIAVVIVVGGCIFYVFAMMCNRLCVGKRLRRENDYAASNHQQPPAAGAYYATPHRPPPVAVVSTVPSGTVLSASAPPMGEVVYYTDSDGRQQRVVFPQ